MKLLLIEEGLNYVNFFILKIYKNGSEHETFINESQ